MAAGVADDRSVDVEVVLPDERTGFDRVKPLDVHAVRDDVNRRIDADRFDDVPFGRLARRENRIGAPEEPPFVRTCGPFDVIRDGVVRDEVIRVLAGRCVIRSHERPVVFSGEAKAADADGEGGVRVNDFGVEDGLRDAGRSESIPLVKRERQASDGMFALLRRVAVGLGIHHVHSTAVLLPEVAPRPYRVGDTVDGR